jgi:hypothetical protein
METKIWWYALNNEQRGPISSSDLKLLIDQNILNPDTLVWKQDFTNWIKYSEIPQAPSLLEQISPKTNSSNSEVHSSGASPEVIDFNLSSVSLYYQKEFEKIISSNEIYKGKWNWWAFLFSWIWCFSKGLWLMALIIFLPVLLLYTFDASAVGFIYAIIFWIFLGNRGTWFYYNLKIKGKQMP